jgi:hypothetical protein
MVRVAMAIQVRVKGFTPSLNGLHFVNAFPHEPVVEVEVPLIGRIAIGDASGGLCGGMAFTVRDVFETPGMQPIADTDPPGQQPGPDSALFDYITDRLIDSFEIPKAGFMKYYAWMTTPDGDTGPILLRRGVAWKTIMEEWPHRIRPRLDAGTLCVLGLVTTASVNPADLGRNHQVLAYGYDLDDSNRLTLLIYDPNTASSQADDVRISLSLANPTRKTPIKHNVGIAWPIRGFFGVDYAYRDPSALAPPDV